MEIDVTVEVTHEETVRITINDDELKEWNDGVLTTDSDTILEFINSGDPHQEVFIQSLYYNEPEAYYELRDVQVVK